MSARMHGIEHIEESNNFCLYTYIYSSSFDSDLKVNKTLQI